MFSRFSGLVVMAGVAAIFAGSGCKGESTGGTGGGGGSKQQDAPVILPPNANGDTCENGEGTCTDQAEIDAYSDCIITTCDAEYKQCFGDGYLTGSFGGPCADLMTCANSCQDCDQTCLKACSDQSFAGACQDCVVGPILDCVIDALTTGKCTLPCIGGGSSGVCDNLKACCESLTDSQEQADCLQTYNGVKLGGDMPCGSALGVYQQAGKCP